MALDKLGGKNQLYNGILIFTFSIMASFCKGCLKSKWHQQRIEIQMPAFVIKYINERVTV